MGFLDLSLIERTIRWRGPSSLKTSSAATAAPPPGPPSKKEVFDGLELLFAVVRTRYIFSVEVYTLPCYVECYVGVIRFSTTNTRLMDLPSFRGGQPWPFGLFRSIVVLLSRVLLRAANDIQLFCIEFTG
jgi:hypothetical protein